MSGREDIPLDQLARRAVAIWRGANTKAGEVMPAHHRRKATSRDVECAQMVWSGFANAVALLLDRSEVGVAMTVKLHLKSFEHSHGPRPEAGGTRGDARDAWDAEVARRLAEAWRADLALRRLDPHNS